ncbi:hypothetical protein ILUMI_03431 [Ignelater luminosus]|uniref:Uncharacterized protein n=1 Tax=Ignelater luminosus TaxID=2038154 RepID=A0A8K0DLU1_IGNLU|nr:hypothetical protein ILUMI_03431 [Ignelater luminosus]
MRPNYRFTTTKIGKAISFKLFTLPETQPPQLPSSTPKRSEQKKRGRPRRLFEKSSHCSKQRHVKPIVSGLSSEKLFLAAE